jgi:hypothetical protein
LRQEGIVKEKKYLSETAAMSFCVVAVLRLTAAPQHGKRGQTGVRPYNFSNMDCSSLISPISISVYRSSVRTNSIS